MQSFIEEILVSQDEIVKIADRLGKRITTDYQDYKPVLIGMLKGAVPFMAELIKHIDCDMEIDFMDVTSYEGASSTGMVKILKYPSHPISGRHVLIVEDIIDTGLTLAHVVNYLKEQNVASVETVCLLDKPEGRKIKGFQPKYFGTIIPNKFVVGFGLDYNELYRNLPFVGVLKKSVYQKN